MRTLKTFALGAVLALSLPLTASAQRKGALEIGGFGRFTKFADTLQLDNGLGGGGRAGVFIFRNWSIEMDVSYAEADVTKRPIRIDRGDSLNVVSHTLWSYRLLYNAPLSERVKLLLGAGYGYDAYGRERDVAPRGGGPQGLVGLRFVMNDRWSLRLEGTGQYTLPEDQDTKPTPRTTHVDLGAQAGISISFFTRDPKPRIQYDTTIVTRIQRDTVYQTRVDTIRIAPATPTTVAGRPVVIGAINFAFNKSDITPEAKLILDKIAASLTEQVNSSRTIDVTGNTDAIGSEQYNIKLGQDRADQAKAYLVSKGVAESRINARTAGEGDPLAPNTTDNGRATNRRVLIMLTN